MREQFRHHLAEMVGLLIHPNSRRQGEAMECQKKLVARIGLTSGGLAKSIELFGDYVARQIGLAKDSLEAQHLADVANEYLRGDKSRADHSLEKIRTFLCGVHNISADEMDYLNAQFRKELDACMISYFAFHWHHSARLLDQVCSGERRLKNVVIAATRKQRVQRVMDTLRVKRKFATLLELRKAITKGHSMSGDMVDMEEAKGRSPVLLMIGGGMGAGKSTVVKKILEEPFWSGVSRNAVVVEADQFKETDVVYRALSSGHGDIAEASQLVHESSTQAAASLLVSALNEGRDVIFDGTMSWEPFVLQTIAMARDVHRRRYRMGPGLVQTEDGSTVEKYWEAVEEEHDGHDEHDVQHVRLPYKIELAAVTCNPLLAVVRGIRRAIITKRAVPIPGQLRSHKLFAASLERYCEYFDHVKIYSTSNMGEPPEVIGIKDGQGKLVVDDLAFEEVKQLRHLNPEAGSVLELYDAPTNNRVWNDIVLSSERGHRQEFLRKMLGSCRSVDSFSIESSPVSSPDSSIEFSDSSKCSSTSSLSSLDQLSSSGSCSSLDLRGGYVSDFGSSVCNDFSRSGFSVFRPEKQSGLDVPIFQELQA